MTTPQGKVPPNSQSEELNVIPQFVAFALAVGLLPPAVYFLSKDYLWNGDTTRSAICAAVSANVLLFAYLYKAWQEEAAAQSSVNEKKAQ